MHPSHPAWMLKYSLWTRAAQLLKTSNTIFTACLINSIFSPCLHKPHQRADPQGSVPPLPHKPSQGALTPSTLPPTSKSTGSQAAAGLKPQLKLGSGRNTAEGKQEGKENSIGEESTDRAQRRLWLKVVVAGFRNPRQKPNQKGQFDSI